VLIQKLVVSGWESNQNLRHRQKNPTSLFEKWGLCIRVDHVFPLLGLQKMIFDKFKTKQIVFVKDFQRIQKNPAGKLTGRGGMD